jgi:hypothetical protein
MEIQEVQLKEAKHIAEEADRKYEEVSSRRRSPWMQTRIHCLAACSNVVSVLGRPQTGGAGGRAGAHGGQGRGGRGVSDPCPLSVSLHVSVSLCFSVRHSSIVIAQW